MKPIEDIREISAFTYGYITSKALFTVVEFDLFTKIASGADTLSKIAEATGVAASRHRKRDEQQSEKRISHAVQ